VFYSLINLIGRTARFEVIGWENHEKAERMAAFRSTSSGTTAFFLTYLLVAQETYRRHDVAQL
jgi:hypothetical protein